MESDIDAIPITDFMTDTWSSADNLQGREWLTGPKVARYFGATIPISSNKELFASHFAIIGTGPVSCNGVIGNLVTRKQVPAQEKLILYTEEPYETTFDITTEPTTGEEKQNLGAQYENCIVMTMTKEDGVSPIPRFMSFNRRERTFTVSPELDDAGLYKVQINYDYYGSWDPSSSLHEHSVLFDIEVLEYVDLSVYFIPIEEPIEPVYNRSNSTNETKPENMTTPLNTTIEVVEE